MQLMRGISGFLGEEDVWGGLPPLDVGTRIEARASVSESFRSGKVTQVHDYGACASHSARGAIRARLKPAARRCAAPPPGPPPQTM